jgi:hypothetical protein
LDSKSKDTPKTKDVLKQMQAELRQLQVTISALNGANPSVVSDGEPLVKAEGKADWVVHYAVYDRSAGAAALKTGTLSFTAAQLGVMRDTDVAEIGSAFSSPSKVALLRALWAADDGGESAANLGQAAALSTGSLYHHLHDLSHADLIDQSGRNRYILTERGRRALLVLLALAVPSPGGSNV